MMVLLAIELPQCPSFMASPWEKSKGASESDGVSYTVVSDSLRPHGLLPARLLCPWDSPGKGTGVGCHSHLQGNLPDPGMEPGSPALQVDSSLLSHQRSQSTEVGSLSLLQWIFPTQEPNRVSCIAGEFSPSEPPREVQEFVTSKCHLTSHVGHKAESGSFSDTLTWQAFVDWAILILPYFQHLLVEKKVLRWSHSGRRGTTWTAGAMAEWEPRAFRCMGLTDTLCSRGASSDRGWLRSASTVHPQLFFHQPPFGNLTEAAVTPPRASHGRLQITPPALTGWGQGWLDDVPKNFSSGGLSAWQDTVTSAPWMATGPCPFSPFEHSMMAPFFKTGSEGPEPAAHQDNICFLISIWTPKSFPSQGLCKLCSLCPAWLPLVLCTSSPSSSTKGHSLHPA